MKTLLFESLILLTWLSAFQCTAQQKPLSPAEAAHPGGLHPLTLPHLTWMPGSDDLAFVEGAGADQHLVRFSAGPGRKTTLLSLADLNGILGKVGGPPVSAFPDMQWVSSQLFVVPVGGRLYTVDVKARLATMLAPLPAAAIGVQVHPDHLYVAIATQEGGLFVTSPGKESVKIAERGQLQPLPASAGQLLQAPAQWSAQGHHLAFLTTLGDPDKQNFHLGIRVYDVQNQQTVKMPEEAAWPYVASLTWAPDGQTVFAGQLNREQNRLRLNQYEASTGRLVKTVLEEQHPGPVRPRQGPMFVPSHSSQFLWLSARDGFAHLYLYDTAGQEIRRLTAGNWVVTELLGFGGKGTTAYYTSTAESPLERHFFSINLQSGQTNRISQGTGFHEPLLSPSGSYFLNNFSSFVVANQIRVLEAGGKIRHNLLTDRNPLQEYRIGDVDLVPIKAPDGADLYSRLITPPGFDRSRRYPVVLYISQNPREQRVLNKWVGGGELWMHWLAQQGYLVFELDGRGTANRGQAFAHASLGRGPDLERQDQQAGVAYLQTLPYVDPGRIGVVGAGAGGFLAVELLTDPKTSAKVGIALYPTPRWPAYHFLFPPPPSAPATQSGQNGLASGAKLLLVQEERSADGGKANLPEAIKNSPNQVETLSVKSPNGNLKEAPGEELLLQIDRFLKEHL